MHKHNLYVITTTQDDVTEVLGVYDADYITLQEILDHYNHMFENSNSYIDHENGFVDVLDINDMLVRVIEVNNTTAFIKNK